MSEGEAGAQGLRRLWWRGRQYDGCIFSARLRTGSPSVNESWTVNRTYKGNDFGGFSDESVGQLFIERDKVANINITIVLLEEDILADLIPVQMLTVVSNLHGEI